jgi:hypothetical protein
VRKFLSVAGCALLLAVGAYAPAQAQGGDQDLVRNWDLRAGFFIPEREPARSAEGDLWFTIGAEKPFYFADRWQGTISIDYYGSGGLYNVPITINARVTTGRLRYGAGAGVGISHDLNRGILGFTYNLMVGYELTESLNPVFADIRYLFLSTSGELNGWAFTIGRKF